MEFTRYVADPVLKPILLIGGEHQKNLQSSLASGTDVVIGTLGKIKDMMERGALDLSQIRFFILDEADQLVAIEGIDEIMRVFVACPSGAAGIHRLQVYPIMLI
jgi:superfamily II DNA/RNA helicase